MNAIVSALRKKMRLSFGDNIIMKNHNSIIDKLDGDTSNKSTITELTITSTETASTIGIGTEEVINNERKNSNSNSNINTISKSISNSIADEIDSDSTNCHNADIIHNDTKTASNLYQHDHNTSNEIPNDDDDTKSNNRSGRVTSVSLGHIYSKYRRRQAQLLQQPAKQRHVRFGYIYVRHYERIVGDHPDTKYGAPLSIGWSFYCEYKQGITLEKYETDRVTAHHKRQQKVKGTRCKRESSKRLPLCALNAKTREHMLTNVYQISKQELVEAEKETKKIRKQRNQSKNTHIIVAHFFETLRNQFRSHNKNGTKKGTKGKNKQERRNTM